LSFLLGGLGVLAFLARFELFLFAEKPRYEICEICGFNSSSAKSTINIIGLATGFELSGVFVQILLR